jgi:hypothetical protein
VSGGESVTHLTVNETTDRYGRPLVPDPEAIRVETDPAGVHVLPMTWDRYALADLEAGAGIGWHDRGHWVSEHVLHVPLHGGDRWFVGYLDDTAIVNHGEGRPRTKGRSLYAYADSSCIAAHPEMGTAADIRRWQANRQWHEARVGDLVVLQCFDPDGQLDETVAARLTTTGWGGTHLDLELVQR